MNWDESLEWERDLALFEQVKRIADVLEKLGENPYRKTRQEKPEMCSMCHGTKQMTDWVEGTVGGKMQMVPIKIECEHCKPIITVLEPHA